MCQRLHQGTCARPKSMLESFQSGTTHPRYCSISVSLHGDKPLVKQPRQLQLVSSVRPRPVTCQDFGAIATSDS